MTHNVATYPPLVHVSNSAKIPDGVYTGTWSNYVVSFYVGKLKLEGVTRGKVRGIVDCKVTVQGRKITVATA